MVRERKFEELMPPAAVAKKLKISVATLRKYSLIIEKVSGKPNYYQRTKQKTRLYTDQEISDLSDFKQLAKKHHLTLQEAAQQLFAVSDQSGEASLNPLHEATLDASHVAQLLQALQQTIAQQNTALADLKQQVRRVEQQNQQLLAGRPMPQSLASARPPLIKSKHDQEIADLQADRHKTAQEVHQEILEQARKNAKKQAHQYRTLLDMQIPEKKSWWQKFLDLLK